MNKEEFIEEVRKLGIDLNKKQLEQLQLYYELLIDYNSKINLTSITKEEDVYLKHFYDSLTLIKAIDLTKELSLCDIGTGAGFPGLVLKIVFPNLKITLLDALNKRVTFLTEVIEKLSLTNIEVYHERCEDYFKKTGKTFDILVARAVAKTNILLELGCQGLNKGSHFILMKGEVQKEKEEAQEACLKLGFSLQENIEFYLPKEESKRTILVYKKEKDTTNLYPRAFYQIKKNPL